MNSNIKRVHKLTLKKLTKHLKLEEKEDVKEVEEKDN